MIGTVLDGRYRILKKLGEGGMGEVYLAEHVNLERNEAIKILHPALAADRQFISRFRREARATNRVQHAHIVGVYDFGQLPDGRFFLAMEYVDGSSLRSVLERSGAMPMQRALDILAQLAEAVDHAHSCGVIHRDLKPENLVLTSGRRGRDFLKVLDFGIAKIIAPEYNDTVARTRQGEIFGTPAYMAPEQTVGGTTDPRCDIYSTGCIGFELLTGAPPFRGGSALEVLSAHYGQAPDPPSRHRRGLPAEVDALILRCLEKDPTARFPTGKDLLAAIDRVPGYLARGERTGQARSLAPAPSDFEESDTQEHTPIAELGRVGEAAPDARTMTFEASEDATRPVVRELAEALLDLGHHDVQLVVGLANARDLERELHGYDSDAAGLEAKIADLEQAEREREASLRFALGELRFDRGRGGEQAADLDFQIKELERRLGEVASNLGREIRLLQDRAVELAATRARADDSLRRLYASLLRLVAEIAPRYTDDERVASLTRRLREMIRSA